jgi:transcriptional regulator with XRE-family HTH domain
VLTYTQIGRIREWHPAVDAGRGDRLGKRLLHFRKEMEWSLSEAASRFGLSVRLLEALETHSDSYHNVGIVILNRIAGVLGVSVADIVSGGAIEKTTLRMPEDANIEIIERTAQKQGWGVEAFLEVRDYYRMNKDVLVQRKGALSEEEVLDIHAQVRQQKFPM